MTTRAGQSNRDLHCVSLLHTSPRGSAAQVAGSEKIPEGRAFFAGELVAVLGQRLCVTKDNLKPENKAISGNRVDGNATTYVDRSAFTQE